MNFNTLLKSFWFWTLLIFIAIQFIKMDVPAQLKIIKTEKLVASTEVMSMLKRSCYDCHSSTINNPWYYNIAPASWYTQLHVRNGRNVVNFSKWNSYNKEKQIKILDKLPKSVVIRMPMLTYLYLHEDAKLTQKEKKVLAKWARELKEEIK